MAEESPSLQDVIRRRQQANFVGRDAHLSLFRENLSLPDTDERKRFVFNVHGDGGVGKTYLLQQLRRVAREHGAAEAYVDEHVYGVPETMALLATQLGAPMAEFRKRYAHYEKRREEVARDPQAPVAAWSRLTRTTVKIGLHASKAIPGAGPIADLVDADSAADAADQVRIYLTRRFTDSKDLQLLLNPIEELTRSFVAGLRLATTEHNAVCLFFDTYERTSPALDGWLLDMFAGRFGSMPAAITWTVAGREPLGSNRWTDYLGIIAATPLRPFSRTEARQLLSARGISDEGTIATILRLSGGLPLLVAMLAEHQPRTAGDIDDPTGTAVERFLKWEDDPDRRTVALLCALPRAVDADIIGVLAPRVDAPAMLEWLCGLPFVSSRAESFEYHPVVRAPMSRMRRRQTPQGWRTAHLDLAENHREWRETMGNESDWSNPQWLHHRLEEMYHRLCVDAPAAENEALNLTVSAAVEGSATARRWLDMIRDAGIDSENEQMVDVAERLLATLHDQQTECVELLTELLDAGVLDRDARVDALIERGRAHHYADREELGVADLTAAIELDPENDQAFERRGRAYGDIDRFDDALADFGRAIELKPENASALAGRGETYRCMDRYEDALEDLNRAVDLKPTDGRTLTSRGAVYLDTERYEDALADLNRAIEIAPEFAFAIGFRGEVLRKLERDNDALADFDRAIEIDPKFVYALGSRAEVLHKMERYEDALADLNRAIELDPTRLWLALTRVATYRAMKRYDDALTDLNRTIERNPRSADAFVRRSIVYRDLERHQDALADADRAIELDPAYDWAFVMRGEVYWVTECYEEAISAFTRAIELNPSFRFPIVWRARVYETMKCHEDALADFTRALELEPTDAWMFYRRGQTYRAMKRNQDALADLNRAIEIDPSYTLALSERSRIYLDAKRYQDALADWNRVIEIGGDSLYVILDRAMTYRFMERYEEAVTDLNRALEMEPESALTVAFRALVHGDLGHYEEAFSGLRQAAELDPASAAVFGIRGEIYLMMGRHEDALIELDRCLELDPEEEDGYEFRAKAFAALGRFDEALTDINRAIELSSGDSDLYGLRSEVYGALGRYEESAADRDARERLMAMYEALPARR